MANPTFEDLYANLQRRLRRSKGLEDLSKNFRPKENDIIHMINTLWELKEFHEEMPVELISSPKNSEKAEQAKNVGNTLYADQHLLRAVDVYNTALRLVDHNSDSLKTLPLTYGNRSSALYELGLYDRCLEDIKRAFDHGFPEKYHHKLYRRRVKCYLAKKQNKEAEDAWREYDTKHLIDNVPVEDFKDFFKDFLKSPKGRPDEHLINIMNKQRNLVAPKPDVCHPNFPSMSDALTLEYTKERGRHLVARRDIRPGEILVSEPAFAAVLGDKHIGSRCDFCHRRSVNPIPCEKCTLSVFCDEKCQMNANRLFHSIECEILPTLLSLDMGVNAQLVLRIAVLLSQSPDYRFPKNYDKGLPCSDPRMAGFNNSGIYDSKNYRPIHHLITNLETRTVGDMFKRSAIAVVSLKLLLCASVFSNEVFEEAKPLSNQVVAAAELFLNLGMSMPCNGHSLTEFYEDCKDYSKSESSDVGAGAFAVLSLMNHSCNPNVNRVTYDTTVVARAIMHIPKGLEIQDNYGVHYGMMKRQQRRKELNLQYRFSCTCYACAMDWPLYQDMTEDVRVRCPYCGTCIDDLDRPTCVNCEVPYNERFYSPNFPFMVTRKKINTEIQKLVPKYLDSFNRCMAGKATAEDEKQIIHMVEILSKYAFLPNKLFFEAQEALKNLQACQGLRFIREPDQATIPFQDFS